MIRTKFNVPWGKAPTSTANADWTGIDAQAALRMADVDPQAIGARVRGPWHVRVQRAPPLRDLATARRGRAGRGACR